jgi:hypothetical protein
MMNRAIRVHHNETWMDFEQFCRRQELGAHSVVHLARAFPEQLTAGDFYRENWPISCADPPARVAKKLIKSLLSSRLSLGLLRHIVGSAHRARIPERYLARAYSSVVGLHAFRGVRRALALAKGTAMRTDQPAAGES